MYTDNAYTFRNLEICTECGGGRFRKEFIPPFLSVSHCKDCRAEGSARSIAVAALNLLQAFGFTMRRRVVV